MYCINRLVTYITLTDNEVRAFNLISRAGSSVPPPSNAQSFFLSSSLKEMAESCKCQREKNLSFFTVLLFFIIFYLGIMDIHAPAGN